MYILYLYYWIEYKLIQLKLKMISTLFLESLLLHLLLTDIFFKVKIIVIKGFKEEYIVDKTESSRCIKIRGGEANWKRVESVLSRVVHPQLGYATELPREVHTYTVSVLF